MNDWLFSNDFREVPGHADTDATVEVPMQLEVLPDGHEALVVGDVDRCRDFNHLQGDNPFGFKGTCGLVSCEDVLRQFGVETSEADVVQHALENGLCNHSGFDPGEMGGTTVCDQAQILTDFGVPASEAFAASLDELATHVEEGRGVIIEVNAGVLWNDANYYGFGEPNHAIVVTGVARDPDTGHVLGAYINDSGRGLSEDSGRFVEAATLDAGWMQAGGGCVVTDVVKV